MSYPLPDLPESNTTICVVIPDSEEWRQLYMGALQQLTRWWYWEVENAEQAEAVTQRVMECQYLTGLDFDGCFEMTCQDVADCIENNQAVIDAIGSIAVSDGNSDVNSGVWANDNFNFESGGICDEASLYGSLDEAISFMNEKAQDMIEQWEVATNVIEFLGVIEDVPFFAPLLDALGSELATEFIEYMFDSLAENYLSNYTVELEDEIECALYCWVKENKGCEFSITDLAQFFAESVLTSITPASVIEDIITYVIAGAWSGNEYVFAFMYIVSGSLAINKIVAGQSWNSFQRRVLLAEPSNEYLFCDCDNVFYLEIDFTAGDGGFVPLSGTKAVYSTGVGWTEVDEVDISTCYFNYFTATTFKVTASEIRFSKAPATSTGFREISLYDDGVRNQVVAVSGSAFAYPSYFSNNNTINECTRILVQIASASQNSNIVVDRMRITIEAITIPAELTSNGWVEYTP